MSRPSKEGGQKGFTLLRILAFGHLVLAWPMLPISMMAAQCCSLVSVHRGGPLWSGRLSPCGTDHSSCGSYKAQLHVELKET